MRKELGERLTQRDNIEGGGPTLQDPLLLKAKIPVLGSVSANIERRSSISKFSTEKRPYLTEKSRRIRRGGRGRFCSGEHAPNERCRVRSCPQKSSTINKSRPIPVNYNRQPRVASLEKKKV